MENSFHKEYLAPILGPSIQGTQTKLFTGIISSIPATTLRFSAIIISPVWCTDWLSNFLKDTQNLAGVRSKSKADFTVCSFNLLHKLVRWKPREVVQKKVDEKGLEPGGPLGRKAWGCTLKAGLRTSEQNTVLTSGGPELRAEDP